MDEMVLTDLSGDCLEWTRRLCEKLLGVDWQSVSRDEGRKWSRDPGNTVGARCC